MIAIRQVRRRAIKAIDSLVDYLPSMHMDDQNNVVIHRGADTYHVNLDEMTCTCQDHSFHKQDSPCKHQFMALIYKNAIVNGESDG